MGDIQRHRGPDDEGEYISAHCGFSFRRLSIIDLAGGHQPMFSPSGNCVTVFNGEIYNFKDLKDELIGKGQIFKTKSDTEVILAGYEMWGEAILDKLRGMFAFVIYDVRKNELFVARDHTGIKPFYYCLDGDNFIFASEIKAILKWPGIKARVNTSMIPRYMSFLWVPAPDTMFKNVYALEPGHMMRANINGVQKKRYWYPNLSRQKFDSTEKEWIAEIDNELFRTVQEQMISDVPLGAFLSGGVDSSSIVAYANRVTDFPITTYTTGLSMQDLSHDVLDSDLKYARLASHAFNVDYNEIILSPDVAELLPLIVWHMDEPVADPAAINTFLICNAAKTKATVMLSGVGGDEIFGGYPRYLADIIARRYQYMPEVIRRNIDQLMSVIPVGSSSFLRNLKKFLKSSSLPFIERYFGYLTYYSEKELINLLKIDFNWHDIFKTHLEIIDEFRAEDPLQLMMNLDLQTFLPYLNLMYTDKMSSAASVEVRVPFLDHKLIEQVACIPSRFKINGLKRKYILKKTVEKYMPKKIVWRKKVGFAAPIGSWLKGQVKEMMYDLLSEETVKRRGYFNYTYIASMISDHMSGKAYNANQIWQLMTLELWHQQFIDKQI
jgi:asparagine synthase (glutamine-hydrolysing)